jgi:hypothetical protein
MASPPPPGPRLAFSFVPVELWNWRVLRQEWAAVYQLAGQPWSEALALLDLRYAEWALITGNKKRLPGYRCLAKDWGWTGHRVRALLDTGRWRDAALSEALATYHAQQNQRARRGIA